MVIYIYSLLFLVLHSHFFKLFGIFLYFHLKHMHIVGANNVSVCDKVTFCRVCQQRKELNDGAVYVAEAELRR